MRKNTTHPVSNIELIKNMPFDKIINSKIHDFLNHHLTKLNQLALWWHAMLGSYVKTIEIH